MFKRIALVALTSAAGLLAVTAPAQQGGTDAPGRGTSELRETPSRGMDADEMSRSRPENWTAGDKGHSGGAEVNPTDSPSGTAALSDDDRDFIETAAQGSLMEIELGRLAQQKGSSDAVRQFGARMEQDHSQASRQLQQVAQQHGVTPPDTLGSEHRQMIQELSALDGGEFDQAYMDAMVEDHDDDIDAFQEAAESGGSADIQQFARQTLPILQQHRQMAESIQSSLEQRSAR